MMRTEYDAMLARLRESIGPTVEDRSAPMQEEDPRAEQLASVLRMLASSRSPLGGSRKESATEIRADTPHIRPHLASRPATTLFTAGS
jgi:hypothetical protein